MHENFGFSHQTMVFSLTVLSYRCADKSYVHPPKACHNQLIDIIMYSAKYRCIVIRKRQYAHHVSSPSLKHAYINCMPLDKQPNIVVHIYLTIADDNENIMYSWNLLSEEIFANLL